MIGLATLVVLCVALALAWWSVRPLVVRKLALAEREMTLTEQAQAARSPATTPSEKMPADLLLYTLAPAEAWARDEAVNYVWQLYRQHGDWGMVRTIINADEDARRAHAQQELSAHLQQPGFLQ